MLECDHEEADSRMFIHAQYTAENENAGRVIITSPDTDVAVLVLLLDVVKTWHLVCRGRTMVQLRNLR